MATSQQTSASLSSSHLNGSGGPSDVSLSLSHSSSALEQKRDKNVTFRFLDLVEEFDEDLLNRFYNELMVKNFPLEDGEALFLLLFFFCLFIRF